MKKIAAEKVDLLLHVPYYTHFQIFFFLAVTHISLFKTSTEKKKKLEI